MTNTHAFAQIDPQSLFRHYSRHHEPTPEAVREHLALLDAGILDEQSFHTAFQYHEHPIKVEVRSPQGTLKALRYTHNLRTNKGGDDQVNNMSGTSVAVASYIAVSADSTAPAVTDTTLAGEITTGGLARAVAAFSHAALTGGTTTTQTSTYTLTITYTASATFTAVQKMGVFNAASSGDMWIEGTYSAVNLASGDTIQITLTVNA